MHSLIIWRRRRWVKESEMVMRSVRVLSKVNDLMSFPEPDDNDDDDDGNRVTRSTTRCVTRISKKGCRIIFERSTERNSLTWKTRNSIDCRWHEEEGSSRCTFFFLKGTSCSRRFRVRRDSHAFLLHPNTSGFFFPHTFWSESFKDSMGFNIDASLENFSHEEYKDRDSL